MVSILQETKANLLMAVQSIQNYIILDHFCCEHSYLFSCFVIYGKELDNFAFMFWQVMDVKRLNNMMSDHGIYSRERLLIPISNPDILVNRTCFIEMDVYAKREVAVLYPNDVPDTRTCYVSSRVSSEKNKKKVVDSLKRSMHVDNETAQYYWSVSNGDPRAALAEFSQDLRWERQVGHS